MTRPTSVTDVLLSLARSDERAIVFTRIDGPDTGMKCVFLLDRNETVGREIDGLAARVAEVRRTGLIEHEGSQLFAEVLGPPPRLVVVGAVDTGDALCAAARALGWRTICVDARARFATPERMPHADEIIVEWPEEAFARIRPDHNSAVVVLTHDEKFDIPALAGALRSDAFYVGALGSRRAQTKRRERLLEAGLSEEELERIHGPCGLDIGAISPAETALSILAEILAVSAGRSGGPLRTAAGRIHVER
jgi:xanthine dehydrogenase accessory factor